MYIITLPEIIVLNRFPLWTPTAIATKNPIVAKSPNGSILFPGTIRAIINDKGINKSPADTTDGSPSNKAGSNPIKNSSPLNLEDNFFLAISDTGAKPSIIGFTTLGIKYITAATSTPS